MSVPLTGTGGLFTRLGKIGAVLRSLNLFRGTGAQRLTSLSGSAGTVTATSQVPHGLTTADTVTIAGANTSTYNGSFAVTVSSTTVFTYSASGSGADTAIAPTFKKTAGVGTYGLLPYANNIEAQYQSTDQSVIDSMYSQISQYQQVHGTLTNLLVTLAQNTFVQMANDDLLQPNSTFANALAYIVGQMVSGSQSVNRPTTSIATAAGGSNNGNGICFGSVVNPVGAVPLDYVINETISITCIQDSQGGAQIGSEVFQANGQAPETQLSQWDYPLGSGVASQIFAVDASLSLQTNILLNSGFDAFTVANTPDGWTIVTGTPGTTIFNGGNSAAYVKTGILSSYSCLQITGNGSELTELKEKFGQTTTTNGSTVALLPSTVYPINLWTKVSSVPVAGVLRVALVDSTGTVINDQAGTPNSFTISLPGETTAYANHHAVFRTPALLSVNTPYSLDFKLTTALDNTVSVFIDHGAMVNLNAFYRGGPYFLIFSGNVKFLVGDNYSVTVGNNYKGQFQLLLDQFFGMRNQAVAVPSNTSPTINDNLIA